MRPNESTLPRLTAPHERHVTDANVSSFNRPRFEKIPIPRDGAPQSFVQSAERRPTEQTPGFFCAQVLVPNFVCLRVPYIRLKVGIHKDEEAPDYFEHCLLSLVGEIEGLAAQLAVRGQALGKNHMGRRSVLRITVVTHGMTIRANDGSLSAQNPANCSGHDSIPIKISAAKKITAPGNGDRQIVSPGISLREK